MEKPELGTLKNGMRTLFAPCEGESVAVGVFVESGSRHEDAKTAGISHFIEHMLFKGTPTRKPVDIIRAIEGRGGNFNAFTCEEGTCYYAHVPREYIAEAVDILADMYLHSSMPDDEFAREKQVVLEEIKMYSDEPSSVASENMQRALFPDCTLGAPIAGTAESLVPMKPADLRRYMKTHYVAERTAVVVAGDFDPADARALVAKAFGAARRAAAPFSKPASPKKPPRQSVVVEKDVQQTQLAVGYRTFGIGDRRKYAMTMLDAILGRGMSSRLFQEVREKRGLSYDVASRQQFFADCGMFSVSAGVDPAKADKALATIDREFKRVAEKRVGAAELKRTKEFLTGNFRLTLEKVTSRLFFYGQTLMTFGRLVEPKEQVEGLLAVTADDVLGVAKSILRDSARTVSRVVPRAAVAALLSAAALSASAADAKNVPAPENVPDLMTAFDGRKIETRAQWEKIRAPELLREFTDVEYGRRPVGRPPKLSFARTRPDCDAMGGKAVRKMVRITYGGKYGEKSFDVLAFVPKQAKPAPAFLLICNRFPADRLDPERVKKDEFWPAEEIVERGYAAIAFYNCDVAPDGDYGNRTGVFSCFENPEPPDRNIRDIKLWGTLSAWAWGASRVLDWIETEPSIDSTRVAVVGHSRGGKTALVAAVYDRRFAMACSNDSGCCGAKLNHIDLPRSEHLHHIVRTFPYWFCKALVTKVNAEKQWRVDQHEFIALIAPRLVCVASATEDSWAGQPGEWWGAKLASPAWELYGKKGLVADAWPAAETPQQEGCISYHMRTGKHNLTAYDWGRYMDFADRHGWRR